MNNGHERNLHYFAGDGTSPSNSEATDVAATTTVEEGAGVQETTGGNIGEAQREEDLKADIQAQVLGEIAGQLEEDMEVYMDQAKEMEQLSLNYYKFKRCYPEAVNKFVEYAANKTKNAQAPLEENEIAGIFLFAPRLLYDFLDSKNINLNIYKAAGDWCFSIVEDEPVYPFENRTQAESAGFQEAFACYEEILTT